MAIDRAAMLATAADRLARTDPLVAGWLRAAAEDLRCPDQRTVRRVLLWRAWRRHWPGMSRSAAAREIAVAWADWHHRGEPDGLPGSIDAAFSAMERAGVRRIAERQIVAELDDQHRPVDCILLRAARPGGPAGA